MERILFNISQVLGITIIHSLWQALFIYFGLKIILALPFKFTSSQKYNLASLALLSITGWFFYTLVKEATLYDWLINDPAKASQLPLMFAIPAGIHQLNTQVERYYYSIAQYLPYITVVYIAGLIFNSTGLLLSRKKIKQLRATMSGVSALSEKANQFATTLGIHKNVAVGLHKIVSLPCITGFIKPVILLPFTLSTYLSNEEIEAIILHELAHIKRNDYLANLVQQTILALLFFNPFVQLISRVINRERENSCDDMVVSISQEPLVYAQALMKLEQGRQEQLGQLALAASGKKYDLLNRIERIMKPKETIGNARYALLTVVLFATAIIATAWLNPTLANGKISVRNVKPLIKKVTDAPVTNEDTTTKKSSHAAPVKQSNNIANIEKDTTDIYRNDPITNDFQLLGFDDPKQDELMAKIMKYSDAIKAIDNSDEYKSIHENLNAAQKALKNYENDVIYDQLSASVSQAGKNFAQRWGTDDGRNDQLGDQVKALGNKIGGYYGSEDFKKMNARLQKKYGIDPDIKYKEGDQNYNNYQAELTARLPADVKNEIAELKQASEKMRQLLHSPEYKADLENIQLLVDSLNHYHTPAVASKYHQAVMQAANQWSVYNNAHRAEMARNQDSIRLYGQQMHDYHLSAEFKQKVKNWRNQMRTALGSDYEKIEHPDRPEKKDTTSNN